jgi:hypothetical protein
VPSGYWMRMLKGTVKEFQPDELSDRAAARPWAWPAGSGSSAGYRTASCPR